jgi:drug/metabolite transporter (DMT)-like permease
VSQNPASPAGNLAVLAALAACLSTALGGSAFVAIRFLVTETEPVTIAFLRNFVAAVVLTAIALLVVRRWPTPRELLVMGAMGALVTAAIILDETITSGVWVGLACIARGILLTNWQLQDQPQREASYGN